MLLSEANNKLINPITAEQLEAIHPIYCLLNFDKSDFCSLVDAIGINKWIENKVFFERLDRAERALTEKEKYLKAKKRLEELEDEKQQLESFVSRYDSRKYAG